MAFEGFPYIVGWELTLACNLNCRHCGSSAARPRARELTLDESLAICDQLPDLLVQEVNFTGGEPLLRPGWPAIAARLNDRGIPAKMLTNGLALGAETIAQMQDAGIAGVGISLDGLEATHDAIRGRAGLFHTVAAGMERVQEAGFPLTVITAVNALNLPELPGLYEWLHSRGVERWQVQPAFPLGRMREAEDLRLSERQYLELGHFIEQWCPKGEADGMQVAPGDSFGYFTEYDTREPPWRGCPAGLISCGITSDGKVKGCLSLPDECVEGDLRQRDLWEIWFHDYSFAYTRQFATAGLGPACRACDRSEQCQGGCSAMSYGSTGVFHNDPYCFLGIRRRGI